MLKHFIAMLRGDLQTRTQKLISHNEEGFEVRWADHRSDVVEAFDWQEIATIIAFKRDCFALDLICLAIGNATSATEINEGDAGWEEFIQTLERRLPGSSPRETWLRAVAQPPFATNQTVVYRKKPQGGQAAPP